MNAPIPAQGVSPSLRVQHLADRLLGSAMYRRVQARSSARIVNLRARRRVRVGPSLSLLFESEETVLLHVYEVLRVEGWSPRRALDELAAYSCLLPGPSTLCGTALIDGGDRREGLELARRLSGVGGLMLRVDGRSVASQPCQASTEPGDPVHYLRWALPVDAREALRQGAGTVELCLDAREFSASVAAVDTLTRELQADLVGRPLPRWLLADTSA